MVEKQDGSGLSRRDFLKSAGAIGALTAVGAATGALEGCSPSSNADSSNNTSTNSTVVTGKVDTTSTAGYTSQSRYSGWLGEAPVVNSSDITSTVTADVVVLGSGHSGIQCAKEAAIGGLTVAVLDMQAEDSFLFYGEDIGTFNSKRVVAMGYGPYDVQVAVAEFMKCSGYRSNPEIVRKFVANSGDMIDDFLDLVEAKNPDLLMHMDVQQASDVYWTDKTKPFDMGNFKCFTGTFCFRSAILDQVASGVGAYSNVGPCELIQRDHAVENGATWYYGHTATVLTQDDSGAVTGVIAKDSDGNYVKFEANKGVVIALGAAQSNPQMVAEFYPEAAELEAHRGVDITSGDVGTGRDVGYGHKLGTWAGGRMDPGPWASLANVSGPGPFGFAPTLQLNCNGERFMNEGDFNAMANHVNRQPLGIYSNLFDANYRSYLNFCGTNHGGVDFGVAEYVAQWESDMQQVVAAGSAGYLVRHGCLTERADMNQTKVYGANDLKTLAGYLGYTGDAVDTYVASVKHYNELCAAGADSDFGKKADFMVAIETPPFYGSVADNTTTAGIAVSLNGLVTDDDYAVLANDDQPIGGLYAVGNCLAGRYALTYPGVLAGNSIGNATTSGYVLGKLLSGQKIN
jgi:hypothetical protein